jgi:iron complex transport system ATP-binding protein
VEVHLGQATVLQEVTLAVEPGGWLALVGPNGAGKSTLLRVLAGLLPHRGTVSLGGQPAHQLGLRARSRRVGYVPQRPTLIASMSVADYVLLGRTPHFAVAGWASRADRQAVADVLDELDLLALASRRLGTLSGGQAQRVVLAHALVGRPQILLLDEPTNALDIGHAQHALDLLDSLRLLHGLTVVTALHELNQAAAYATEVALLHEGRLHAHGTPAQVLTTNRLTEVYHARVHVTDSPTARPHITLQR